MLSVSENVKGIGTAGASSAWQTVIGPFVLIAGRQFHIRFVCSAFMSFGCEAGMTLGPNALISPTLGWANPGNDGAALGSGPLFERLITSIRERPVSNARSLAG